MGHLAGGPRTGSERKMLSPRRSWEGMRDPIPWRNGAGLGGGRVTESQPCALHTCCLPPCCPPPASLLHSKGEDSWPRGGGRAASPMGSRVV